MKEPNNPKIGSRYVVSSDDSHVLFKKGDVLELVRDDHTECPEFSRVGHTDRMYFFWRNLEPLTKTLDNLEVGDVLENEHGFERKVLAALPGAYLLSHHDKIESAYDWYTPYNLKEAGYILKNQPQDYTIELSLQEVADKFGIPVDKLRIKE